MIPIVILTFTSIYWTNGQPINILNTEQQTDLDGDVLVPYNVEYLPIEVRTDLKKETNSKPTSTSDKKDDQLILNSKSSSVSKLDSAEKITPVKEDTETFEKIRELQYLKNKPGNFDPFEDKFNEQSEISNDYVLVPISTFRKLQDASEKSQEGAHTITKRQAPGGVRVTPAIQFTSVLRNRRRIFRGPALVGYLNDDLEDLFPTVA